MRYLSSSMAPGTNALAAGLMAFAGSAPGAVSAKVSSHVEHTASVEVSGPWQRGHVAMAAQRACTSEDVPGAG